MHAGAIKNYASGWIKYTHRLRSHSSLRRSLALRCYTKPQLPLFCREGCNHQSAANAHNPQRLYATRDKQAALRTAPLMLSPEPAKRILTVNVPEWQELCYVKRFRLED